MLSLYKMIYLMLDYLHSSFPKLGLAWRPVLQTAFHQQIIFFSHIMSTPCPEIAEFIAKSTSNAVYFHERHYLVRRETLAGTPDISCLCLVRSNIVSSNKWSFTGCSGNIAWLECWKIVLESGYSTYKSAAIRRPCSSCSHEDVVV